MNYSAHMTISLLGNLILDDILKEKVAAGYGKGNLEIRL
jgi:hypothetical protein